VLSFLLYAGLVGAGALLLVNVYQGGSHGTLVATESAPSSAAPATPERVNSAPSSAPSASSEPSLAVTVTSSELPPPPAITPVRPAASTGGPSMTDGVIVAPDPFATKPAPRSVGETSAPPASGTIVITGAPASSEPPSEEPVPEAEATEPPLPDAVDSTLVAPVPATMSPELAAQRKATVLTGSDL
jgi:hypothetical protein